MTSDIDFLSNYSKRLYCSAANSEISIPLLKFPNRIQSEGSKNKEAKALKRRAFQSKIQKQCSKYIQKPLNYGTGRCFRSVMVGFYWNIGESLRWLSVLEQSQQQFNFLLKYPSTNFGSLKSYWIGIAVLLK